MFSYKYLLLATSLLSAVNAQVLNLITNSSVEGYWLESGYVYLDDANWVSVSTTELNATEPIVFLSLPPVEGDSFDEGYPSAPRVRNIAVNSEGTVTFDAKIYLVPNDTTKCSHQWSVPQPITVPFEIAWTVVEKGAYSLGGHYFFAFDGEIWRHNASLKGGLTNGPNDEYIPIHYMGSNGTNICSALPGNNCKFPNSLAHPSPSSTYYDVAAISTLQTLRNDQFLMVRGASATLQTIRLVLTPNDFLNPLDYNITYAERAGVFVFEKGLTVLCKEHLSFETDKIDGITSNAVLFKFSLSYEYTPGIYGMILTQTSIVDSTGLRVFDRNATSAQVILQEDQCVDEQVEHTNLESVGLLIVGETAGDGDIYCFMIYNHPTSAPTPTPFICSTFLLYDTFGDGWGENIFFDVTSVDYDVDGNEVISHQNFTVNCTCNEIEVCSATGYFNVSVVTAGEPVRNWWEVMWGYVDRFGKTWIGDIDSEATISENEVIWYRDFVSYNVSDNPCDDCPPKPAPPKKDKKDSKDDKAKAPSAPENNDNNSTSSDNGDGEEAEGGPGAGKGDAGKGKGKKTPPPPAFVDIELKDTEKYGWYDSNGDWVQVCPDSDILFPAVLVYPRYYISNQQRTEIIHSGSLCPQDDKFFCHEILPHEGKFVFRVNGFEVTPGDISWEFCGKSGGLHDELQFEMHKGHCHAGVLLSAEDYCDGIVTLGSYAGFMTLSGISHGSLSEIDTLVIEHIILGALSIPSATVSIVSTHVSGSSLNIEFALTVELEKAGYDGVFSDMVDASLEDFTTTLSYSASHGFLMTLLTKELKTSLLSSEDILNSVTEISFTKLELVSVTYSDVTKSSAIDKVYTSEDSIATDSNSHPAFNPVVAGLASFFGVLAAGGLLVFIIMKTRSGDKQGHVLLPTESSHHGREIPMAEAVPVLTKKLSQFPKN